MYVFMYDVCMEDPYDPQPRSLTGTYNMHVDMSYVVYIVVSTHRAVIISIQSNNNVKTNKQTNNNKKILHAYI